MQTLTKNEMERIVRKEKESMLKVSGDFADEFNDDEVVMLVRRTRNYGKFKKMRANRIVNKKRLNALVASIKKKYIINPIIVNEFWEIVEGQGRFEALKVLNMPIDYIMVSGLTIDDCSLLNRTNTPWNKLDWIMRWADDEDLNISKNYENLLSAMEKSGFGATRVLRLAYKGTQSRSSGDDLLQGGRLKFSEQDIDQVISTKQFGENIIDALRYESKVNETFWIAVAVLHSYKELSIDRLLSNCRRCSNSYVQCAKLEDQLKEFTRIYNYNRQNGKLYFEDYMRNKGYNVRTYEDDGTWSKTDMNDVSTLKMAT